MRKYLTIKNTVLSLLILLIVLRIDLLLNLFYLLYLMLKNTFYGNNSSIKFWDFLTLDYYFSLLVLVTAIIFLFISKRKFLLNDVDFTNFLLILLGFVFLFAPLISNYNPNFQKDLIVTQLLPPLTAKKIVQFKTDYGDDKSNLSGTKYSIIKRSFDPSIMFADSYEIESNNIRLFQRDVEKIIPLEKIKFDNNKPIISSKIFILGTDHLGRDIFSRLIFGTRYSLLVGFGAVIVSLLLGLLLGFISGFFGDIADILVNRFSDIFLTFPAIFMIILILALFGNNIFSIIIVLGISGWMPLYKIIRDKIITIKRKDYYLTSKKLGMNRLKLFYREILPSLTSAIVVNLILLFSYVVLTESALSFIGLTSGIDYPSWGAMISEGQEYFKVAWWIFIFPSLTLTSTVLLLELFSKKIERYFNPRLFK